MSVTGTILAAVSRVAKDMAAQRKRVEALKLEIQQIKQAQAAALGGTIPISHLNPTQVESFTLGEPVGVPEGYLWCSKGVALIPNWANASTNWGYAVAVGYFIGEAVIEGTAYRLWVVIASTDGPRVGYIGLPRNEIGQYGIHFTHGALGVSARPADYYTRNPIFDYAELVLGTAVVVYPDPLSPDFYFALSEPIQGTFDDVPPNLHIKVLGS